MALAVWGDGQHAPAHRPSPRGLKAQYSARRHQSARGERISKSDAGTELSRIIGLLHGTRGHSGNDLDSLSIDCAGGATHVGSHLLDLGVMGANGGWWADGRIGDARPHLALVVSETIAR